MNASLAIKPWYVSMAFSLLLYPVPSSLHDLNSLLFFPYCLPLSLLPLDFALNLVAWWEARFTRVLHVIAVWPLYVFYCFCFLLLAVRFA